MCGRVDYWNLWNEMTPEQFRKWQAKDIVEPIGHRGTTEILALLTTIVGKFVGVKDASPEMFAFWKQPEKRDDTVSHETAIMALESIGAKRG